MPRKRRRDKRRDKRALVARHRALGARWSLIQLQDRLRREQERADREKAQQEKQQPRVAAQTAAARLQAFHDRQAKVNAEVTRLVARAHARSEQQAAADFDRTQREWDHPMRSPAQWSPSSGRTP